MGASDDEHTGLTIDELATRVGMSVRNLREWRSLGLLPPPTMRGRTGYYDEDTVRRVELIQRLHGEGFTLQLIARLLDASEESGTEAMEFASTLRAPFRDQDRPSVDLDAAGQWPTADADTLARAIELGLIAERDDGGLEFTSARIQRAAEALNRLGMPSEDALRAAATIRDRLSDITQLFEDLWRAHVWEPYVAAGMPEERLGEIEATLKELQAAAVDAVVGMFTVTMDDQIAQGIEREVHRVLQEEDPGA